jgi:hypothetical protein
LNNFNLFTGILLLILCSACQPVLATPGTGQTLHLLYMDDFSDNASDWTPAASANSGLVEGAAYTDGVYRIRVDLPNSDVWVTPGLDLGDTRIEVDAIKVGGDRNNRFGILCRAQGPGKFYVFLISSDGYYGIGKINGMDYQLLGSQALLPSDKIPKGSAYLRLRADCIQDRLALYVNGEKIFEVQDAEFQKGDVGIITGAYNSAGVDILFDNFVVYRP